MERWRRIVLCAVLLLVIFGRPAKTLAAADLSYPYWIYCLNINCSSYVARNGDSPGLGLAMARESYYAHWGFGAPTPTCVLDSITTARCQWGNLRGIADRYCSTFAYAVGQYCMGPDGVKQPSCQATVANPVAVGSGAKTEAALDYSTSGPEPLDFVRTYYGNIRATYRSGPGSARAIDTSRFGLAWRTKYDSGLAFTSASPAVPANDDRVNLMMPDGMELAFIYSSSLSKWRPAYFNWTTSSSTRKWTAPRSDIDIAFDIVGTEARVTYKNGDVWAYGLNGLLNEIRYKSGYTQTLSYTGANNTSITDNLGRSLTFTYNSLNLLSSMSAPDGKIYQYTYADPVGGSHADLQYVLKEIIYPDSTPASDTDNPRVTYHYEDTRFPSALTGITDERGVRYATWTYDVLGRALTSTHAGGVDSFTISYDDTNNKRTVTNPLGKQTVYHYQLYQGRQRITKVEGKSSANCAASDTTYAYDSVGQLG